jgi:hypothetical protein
VSEQNPYSPPQAQPDPEPLALDQMYAPSALGPRGIGGWLVLPMLSLIITPFRVTFTTVRDFSGMLKPGVWDALTRPGGASYHPMWAPVILSELLMNIALVVGTVWLAVLFFKKSRRVPTLMIVWIAGNIGIQVVDRLLTRFIPALAEQAHLPELIRGLIAAAIWIPYFMKSVRVRNTFVN